VASATTGPGQAWEERRQWRWAAPCIPGAVSGVTCGGARRDGQDKQHATRRGLVSCTHVCGLGRCRRRQRREQQGQARPSCCTGHPQQPPSPRVTTQGGASGRLDRWERHQVVGCWRRRGPALQQSGHGALDLQAPGEGEEGGWSAVQQAWRGARDQTVASRTHQGHHLHSPHKAGAACRRPPLHPRALPQSLAHLLVYCEAGGRPLVQQTRG
jgi:hypothetical protein